MSDFVEFPEQVYVDAGDVFATFDGTLSRFTPENALAMMWFAQLAYEVDDTGGSANATKIAKVRDQWHFQSITPFRERAASLGKSFNATGLIGERRDAIVLAFAGTDPGVWETVVTDARFQLGPQNTHNGFQAAFRAVAPLDAQGRMLGPIADAIVTSSATGKPIFITGHSLGAALGILAADAMAVQGTPPRALYGFGTPCPGGATFQQRYNAALGNVTYRLVHGRDVVARVPMLPGYVHVGCLLQTERDTKFGTRQPTGLSDDPKFFAPAYLQEIASYLLGGGIFGFFRGLVTSLPTTPQEFAQAVIARLPPRGHGRLGEWFRLLPPFIREHLQDRYIEALTPGAARIRSDV